MKLHLPIKLRASLIAAVIAVSAGVYNARGAEITGTHYLAPSADFGWDQNDISLSERYLRTAGNTYTATADKYVAYKVYENYPKFRVGYALSEDGSLAELEFDGSRYFVTQDDESIKYVNPVGYYSLSGDPVDEDGRIVTDTNGQYLEDAEQRNRITGDLRTDDPALITIKTSQPTNGQLISFINGNTTLTTNDTLSIENSLRSGYVNLDSGMDFKGNIDIETNSIRVTKDSNGQGSVVVLEDVSIKDYAQNDDVEPMSTQIAADSRLVILDGSTATLTKAEKDLLDLGDIDSSENFTAYRTNNEVTLGDVSGQGGLTIVGQKERTTGTENSPAYENIDGKDDELTVNINSIRPDPASAAFGEVNIANADVDIAEGITKATTVTLVNSVTTTGKGISSQGFDVNSESVLSAAEGNITNMANQGAGHVDISGKVEAKDGSILLSNGQKEEGYGVKQGATLNASRNITLSNVDVEKAHKLVAGEGDLFLTVGSTINDTHDVSVGSNLVLDGGSAITNSTVGHVGGDVVVTDRADGSTAEKAASEISGSRITVDPTDTSSVTIANGSTMQDSFIKGANGDITIGGKDGKGSGVTVGLSESSEASKEYISQLGAILELAKESDKSRLTEEGINGKGMTVGSMIGNTSGNVTITKDAEVASTVITAGGSIAIGDMETEANADLMEQIRAQLPSVENVGDVTGKFDTLVSGSIIDVRGNLGMEEEDRTNGLDYPSSPKNDLSIGDSAVTDSIILGITGDIKVKDSVLKNDYIDGGAGLDIEDSIVIDTNIVNMQADIRIAGDVDIISSNSEKPWVFNTKGTADYTDKDNYTGGSIILNHTTLSDGVIKSGYLAVYDPENSTDGTGFTWEKLSDQGEALTGNPSSDSSATSGSTGKPMPYGEIKVTDAALTRMDVETVRGDVRLGTSAQSVVSTTSPLTPNNRANSTNSLTTTIAKLVGATLDTNLGGIAVNKLAVQGRDSNGSQPESVQMKLVYTDISGTQHTVYSSNTIDWANGGAFNEFTFVGVENADPNAAMTISIVNSGSHEAVEVGYRLCGGGDIVSVSGKPEWGSAIMNGEFTSTALGMELLKTPVGNATVNTPAQTTIIASDIKTGDGSLIADSIVSDSLVEGEGDTATEKKTHISVTNESSIKNSVINGTDISVKDGTIPSLTIMNSIVKGNVNLDVDNAVTVGGGTEFALDGDRRGEGKRDASVKAASLALGDLHNNEASLSNGTIAVTEYTGLLDGDTFTLSNVNSLEAEGAGQLAHVTEMEKGTAEGMAKLVITEGSAIEIGRIDAVKEDAADTTTLSDYFDSIVVDGDSRVTVQDIALIEKYEENVGKKDVNGSDVTFKKDAWLTEASISGVGEKPTSEFGSAATAKLTQTTMEGAAHIGTLTLENEGILNLKATEEGTTSYIADLKPATAEDKVCGTINVVGETLKTPVLNSEKLSLGLNGGTVVLEQVSKDDGATHASESAVNAHVVLREITDAQAITGAKDHTPVGSSTIKTTLNRLVEASSSSMGEAVTQTAKVYHYVVMHDITLADGTELHAGDVVAKSDLAAVTTELPLLGSVVTGVVPVDAALLTPEEQTYLTRITNPVPVLGEDGQQVMDEQGRPVWEVAVDEQGRTLTIVGQLTTIQDIVTYPDAAGTLGQMEEKTDGIASLTVKGDFDADNTTIKAYQTASEVAVGEDTDVKIVVADENSGFITIEGRLTGENNTLEADNDISIGGIIAEAADAHVAGEASVVTGNKITSVAGSITIGKEGSEVGINASGNTLTAAKDITTTSIKGNTNALTAGESIATDDITGNENALTAGTTITTGAIEGDSNTLTAGESIATDDITGNENALTAGTTITTGAIEGDSNTLDAKESITTGDITGNENALTAGTTIATGDINGNSNTLTAGESIATGDITGNENALTAGTTINTGDINGDSNTLDAKESITTGDITGDKNALTAGTTINTGDINGNSNTLDAKESITTGDITGDKNALTAGTTITTGAITGNENSLLAGEAITVNGGLNGDSNALTAGTDVTITGTMAGQGNLVSAVTGSVTVNGDVIGEKATQANELTAGTTINIDGVLSGEGTQILAYGNGLSQDDVAISVGVFAAQGTDLRIATTSDPVFGVTNGNGSIEIGSMGAVVDKDGNAVEVNKNLVSNIVSNNSYVFIGALNGSNAVTKVTAAKDIIIGNSTLFADCEETLPVDKASNLTLEGANIILDRLNGIELTDSVITTRGSITGTKLTLTTSGETRFTSTAANVTLTDLELGNYAVLNASGAVDLQNLTIDGRNAALISSDVMVRNMLTLRNGAVFDVSRLNVKSIEISDSTLTTPGDLTLEGTLHAAIGTEDGDLKRGANINVLGALSVGELKADSKSVISALSIAAEKNTVDGVETTGDIIADGGTIKATAGDIEADGNIAISNGGTVKGTNVKADGVISVGTALSDDTALSGGSLTADGGSISGASMEAHSAIISATQGISLGGELKALDGTQITGSVTKVTDVEVKDGSSIHGSVSGMTGALTLDNGTVEGSVTGATSASITNGSSVGALSMSGDDADITASGSDITGAITGARNVTLTNTSAKDISLTGKLTATGNSVGNISGANGVELTDVQTGDITGLQGELKATGATIGNLTQEKVEAEGEEDTDTVVKLSSVTLKDTTVQNSGTITAEGDISLDNSAMGGSFASDKDVRITNHSTVKGDVNGKDVTIADSTVGTVAAMNATLTNSIVDGSVTTTEDLTTNGDVIVEGEVKVGKDLTVNQGTLDAGTNDVTVTGKVKLNNGEVKAGKLSADEVTLSNMGGDLTSIVTKEDIVISGGSINLTGDPDESPDEEILLGSGKDLILSNGTAMAVDSDIDITGNVTVEQNSTLAGQKLKVGKELNVTGGSELNVSSVTGATNVTITDSAVNSSVDMSGKLTVTDGSVGDVTGASSATITDASVGNLTMKEGSNGNVSATNGIVGNISNAGDVTLTNTAAGTVSMSGAFEATRGAQVGDVTDASSATITDASVGNLSMKEGSNGNVSATDGIVGNISNAGDVALTNTTAGTVSMSGAFEATRGAQVGDVTGASSATITDASVGNLSMKEGSNGKVSATDGIVGNISNAGDVTLTNTTAGTVSMSGKLAVTDGTVMGDVTNSGGSTVVNGAVAAQSLITGDLDISTASSLTAASRVETDGLVTIAGELKTDDEVNLKGIAGSAVTGTVLAAKDVTLDGTMSASGADISGANVKVVGSLAAGNSTLTGEKIAVDGTLLAGKGTELNGTVSGTGTINKTGGDTLVLGRGTDMAGGAVNIADASVLDAADGAHLGAVTVGKGSTLELAGQGTTGVVRTDALILAKGAALNADIELGKSNDKVTGTVDMGGNSLNLNSISAAGEKEVTDGTIVKVFSGSVKNVNEDIVHNLDTLNAHMEQNGDVVLSKNYKSAGETENQAQTASALTSINPNTLEGGSALSEVFDALNHTRSAEEARAALDSLSGAGLAGIQKTLADETAEHMQTLRSTLTSLAANLHRKKLDAAGRPVEDGTMSSALSGAVTGGSSQLSGNGNSGKYDRSSVGFMLAGAHAVTNEWTFGGDLAMSFADAKCDSTDITATVAYADVALIYNGTRFHQMGTLGFGLFDIETERRVAVSSKGHDFAGTAKGSTQAMTVNLSYQGVYDLIRNDDGHLLSTVIIGEASFGQIDAMTENGLGDAGLRSEFDDVASLSFAAGLRYTYEFGEKTNPGYFTAEALFVANAGDTMPKVNNLFIGGGNGFEVAGPEAGNTGVRLNAGVLIPVDETWGIFGNATTEFRSKQTSVGGSVGVKCSF